MRRDTRMIGRAEEPRVFERSVLLLLFAFFLNLGTNIVLGTFFFALPLGARVVQSALTVIASLVAASVFHRRIKPKPPTEGFVLVRWGRPPETGAIVGFFLCTASTFIGLFTLITAYMFTPTGIPSEVALFVMLSFFLSSALPFLRWIAVFMSGMVTLVGAIGTRGSYYEVVGYQTRYAEPKLYDTLAAARAGKVVLGHEFARVIELTVPRETVATTRPTQDIQHSIIERLVGEDGPYVLDLLSEVNPHIAATGASGQGKTVFIDVLTVRSWLALKLPSLIVDWTGVHADLIREIGGVVWDVPTEFKLNPLRLGKGSSPATRADEIIEAMRFGSEAPVTPYQSGELRRIILRAYEEAGIRETDGMTWTRQTPRWHDLIRILEERLKAGYYEGTMKETALSIREKLYLIEPIVGEEPLEFFDVVEKIPTCLNMKPLQTADSRKAIVTYHIYQRIYQQFFTTAILTGRLKQSAPFLRMMVIVDEAHLVLGQKAADSGLTKQESLLVHVVRMGRQYGFSTVFASQLMTDLPEEVAGNAAVFLAFLHGTTKQEEVVMRQFKLSRPEVEMYRRMPRGTCFIRRIGRHYADYVKIQMLSDEEIQAAYQLSKSIQLPQVLPPEPETRPETPETPAETEREEQAEVTEPIEIETAVQVHCSNCGSELAPESKFCNRCGNPVIQTPKPETPTAKDLEGLTLTEKRLLHSLSFVPMTFRDLNTKFKDVKERQLRNLLAGLEGTFIHSAKVPTLVEGKNDVYYAALTTKELRRESLEHRALVLQLEEALLPLGATVFMQAQRQGGNVPDIGLPLTKPTAACIEVETGRKKQSLMQMSDWARNVKQRNKKLGYERTVVVVPNVVIERRYKEICVKHNLELVTMANLAEHLHIELVTKAEPPPTMKPSAQPDEEKEEPKQEPPAEAGTGSQERTSGEGQAEAKLRKLLQDEKAEDHSSA
jgi:hypothetical protein